MHVTPRQVRGPAVAVVAVVSLAIAGAAVISLADGSALRTATRSLAASPGGVVVALVAFAGAFALRAVAWRTILPSLPFGQAWAALHVSLAGNHVLPLRLGEPLRIASVARRTRTPLDEATASTVALRAADTVAVAVLAAFGAPRAFIELLGPWGWLAIAGVVTAGALAWRWVVRLARRAAAGRSVRRPGVRTLLLTISAWALEAVLVWQAARWAGIDLTPIDALTVTAASVVAQVAAIAPGGLGTYEAAATATYVSLGHDAGAGLVAALLAHGLKTAYSLVVGAGALFAPAPGMLGRLRLSRGRGRVVTSASRASGAVRAAGAMDPDAPVVLFLPAHNEAAAVGDVVRRVPPSTAGRPVRCIVVDDGSDDGTAAVAKAAGATVVSMGANQGLGAAVRRGLHEAVVAGAAAVAFCDADGEYAPEELERLVTPILDGRADYVVGSRFHGRPARMLAHRRAGNVLLTRTLRAVSRLPISDGQSGYRALSAEAARAAEVIHDYNYAQVLTLDLAAKGYRYAEVPISYHFRTEGESFVRVGRYLRNVVPAVWRELNTA